MVPVSPSDNDDDPRSGHGVLRASIADFYARYPTLRIVCCANREIAETSTRNYFAAISGMPNRGSAEVDSQPQHAVHLDADDDNFDVDET